MGRQILIRSIIHQIRQVIGLVAGVGDLVHKYSHYYLPQDWGRDQLWGRLCQVAGPGLDTMSGDHDAMHSARHDASARA
jgi:hypothetical protein